MSINKIALLLAVLLGHALALCNATAPVDSVWLDAARARMREAIDETVSLVRSYLK